MNELQSKTIELSRLLKDSAVQTEYNTLFKQITDQANYVYGIQKMKEEIINSYTGAIKDYRTTIYTYLKLIDDIKPTESIERNENKKQKTNENIAKFEKEIERINGEILKANKEIVRIQEKTERTINESNQQLVVSLINRGYSLENIKELTRIKEPERYL